jgi:hypothetical protein
LSGGWFSGEGILNGLAVARRFDPAFRRAKIALSKRIGANSSPLLFCVFGVVCGKEVEIN